MRTIIVCLTLAVVAGPAAAQTPSLQLDTLRDQQRAADLRAVDQSNQLMALEARQRTEAAALDARIQRGPLRVPDLPYAPPSTSGVSATGKYPSMPDAALAESNRRVRAAAENRR